MNLVQFKDPVCYLSLAGFVVPSWSFTQSGFSQTHNIGIRGFTMWKQILAPVSIEPGPLIVHWFQIQRSPFWTNLAFACKHFATVLFCFYVVKPLMPTRRVAGFNLFFTKIKLADSARFNRYILYSFEFF